MIADILAIDVGYATAYGCAAREVEFVRSTVDWIVFDSRRHVESSLLEAETHPTRSSEQIYAYRPSPVAAHQTKF
jgi:hypothetical protein